MSSTGWATEESLIPSNILNFPYEEKFICKVAKNTKEASKLIEVGFEYVTGKYGDGGKLFKKRKSSYLELRTGPNGVVV